MVDRGGWESFLDTCWPEVGFFNEYDGQKFHGQPVYDANRERRVKAVTGWQSTRITWNEARFNPVVTGRQVAALFEHARRRRVLIV